MFKIKKLRLFFVCFTQYYKGVNAKIAFRKEKPKNIKIPLASAGLTACMPSR